MSSRQSAMLLVATDGTQAEFLSHILPETTRNVCPPFTLFAPTFFTVRLPNLPTSLPSHIAQLHFLYPIPACARLLRYHSDVRPPSYATLLRSVRVYFVIQGKFHPRGRKRRCSGAAAGFNQADRRDAHWLLSHPLLASLCDTTSPPLGDFASSTTKRGQQKRDSMQDGRSRRSGLNYARSVLANVAF